MLTKGELKLKIKVMSIFGTRPEAIKMAPVVKSLEKDTRFESIVVVTGQHRQMLDQVLTFFKINPDYDLNIMQKQQTLTDITNKVLSGVAEILLKESPDIILVHGDTTTSYAAALAAFYHKVKIGHVEAGLRTWNKYSPFPEEINRQLTDVLADLYFAPTFLSKNNLLSERHPEDKIFVTGNTAIDAMKYTVGKDYHHEIIDSISPSHKIILVTMHRRENLGKPMENVYRALNRVIKENPEVEIIFPIHKNPAVRAIANDILIDSDRIHIIEPLEVIDFHNMAARSYLILTDSGGVQEEAPSLGVPVLVLRDTTERPEGIDAGTLKLVGTDEENVYNSVTDLLKNEQQYLSMSQAKNPYGDGFASDKILDAIYSEFANN